MSNRSGWFPLRANNKRKGFELNMRSTASKLLLNDHDKVGDLLGQLLAALHDKDVQSSYAKLDLLWARLAVHIRAEHLHLFPAVLNALSSDAAAEWNDVRSQIERLREDHNFFMRELARAVSILRELPLDSPDIETRLTSVLEVVLEVEKRLANHNEMEENYIYRWATKFLTKPEQMDLARRINAELEHRPSRFSVNAWANDR